MDGVRVGEVGDEGDGALEEEATAVGEVVVEGGGEAVPDAVACRSERRESLTHSLLLHEAAHLLDAATLLVGGGLGPVQQGVPVQLPITPAQRTHQIAVDFVKNEGAEGNVLPPVPRGLLRLDADWNALLEDDGLDVLLALPPGIALAAANEALDGREEVERLVTVLLGVELHHPPIGRVDVTAGAWNGSEIEAVEGLEWREWDVATSASVEQIWMDTSDCNGVYERFVITFMLLLRHAQ